MGEIIRGTTFAFAGALAVAPAAHADTFEVTNKSDSGQGSLRQALLDAQSTGFDRIVFRSGLSGTILTTAQLPHINGPLSLEGPGADRLTISGGDDHRILQVAPSPGMDVRISGLTLADGKSPSGSKGGALRSLNADLTLDRVVVRDSRADYGGGIAVLNESLTLVRSTVSGNLVGSLDGRGGGILGEDATIRLIRSTVSANRSNFSPFGVGGGVSVVGGTLRVLSSTVTGNKSLTGGGLSVFQTDSDPSLTNSIVAGNTAGSDENDISGGTWHLAFTLLGSKEGATVNEVVPGSNIVGRAPRLGALRNNGGSTPTHALLGSSPAVNRGAPGAACVAPDQRGAPRAGRCDIGAYERVFCAGALVNRVGTGGRDVLRGSAGRDGILGLGGGDRLVGFGGRDGLCGGPGNDRLLGGPGVDRLLGQRGFDRLFGGAQRDFLFGGGQADRLFGQRGSDRLFGGPGRDLLVGGSQRDLLRPGPGRDRTRQ